MSTKNKRTVLLLYEHHTFQTNLVKCHKIIETKGCEKRGFRLSLLISYCKIFVPAGLYALGTLVAAPATAALGRGVRVSRTALLEGNIPTSSRVPLR